MQVNGDAIIARLAQRIGQLIAENEMLTQRLIELQEQMAEVSESGPVVKDEPIGKE